jgi:ferredoxin
MLHFDIPAYRLPRAELMQEVRRIEAMGVKLVLDHKVEDLLAERDAGGFDAVFVALGAHVARHVDIPARDAARVLDTVSLLHEVGSGEQPRLGRRVVIYGGGSPRVHFSLVVYVEDCTGCGICVEVCPAHSPRNPGAKAINLDPKAPILDQAREDIAFFAELPVNDHLAPDGRVMEILSEHTCQGWLEGYLLTGRHGLFSCYEAFIHIVDSMFNQHAKWLKVTGKEIPWRRPIASLNYLLTSHVWRQDHNGFSHQDPGFIDHVVNKKADVIRVYLPPDANTLLCVTDCCLRSRNFVNVIVAGKQLQPQWLHMDAAIKHCTAGIGIWDWAGNDQGSEPDVVMACAGDVPTLEILAAVDILRRHLPELKVRVINVVDLMTLQDQAEHSHGLSHKDFDTLFTTDRPIIFAYHGYPWLIHRLTYRRTNHKNLHVRGYKEEGTTTTPFDMVVRNDMDRFHLGNLCTSTCG